MDDTVFHKIRRALLSPVFLFSVCLMALNDHILKGAGILSPQITGKLSDFAFLFFVPIVVAYLFRVTSRRGLSISYVMVGVSFSAINVSPYCSRLVESLFGVAFLPLTLWPDPTDLITLTMLPCSLLFVLKGTHSWSAQPLKYLELSVAFVCLLVCAATSPAMRPTHEPLYLSWQEFRTSVEVMPPQEIKKRGKIYIKESSLYINEPNKGIHIFDNSDPENPVPKCFLSIPGNTDIAIKGSYLYADSFVDLLVFALTMHPEDIILVNRVKDVFPYDAYQTQPFAETDENDRGRYFQPTGVNKRKGVVIGWRGIQKK